jgi:hypothetical protein
MMKSAFTPARGGDNVNIIISNHRSSPARRSLVVPLNADTDGSGNGVNSKKGGASSSPSTPNLPANSSTRSNSHIAVAPLNNETGNDNDDSDIHIKKGAAAASQDHHTHDSSKSSSTPRSSNHLSSSITSSVASRRLHKSGALTNIKRSTCTQSFVLNRSTSNTMKQSSSNTNTTNTNTTSDTQNTDKNSNINISNDNKQDDKDKSNNNTMTLNNKNTKIPQFVQVPMYQVSFEVKNAGKILQATKKSIKWIFGYANQESCLVRQSKGEVCRGEEHQIELVWSLTSGKRKILLNGLEVHCSGSATEELSTTNEGKFDHTFKMKDFLSSRSQSYGKNHYVRLVAYHNGGLLRQNSDPKSFELSFNGFSFYDLPRTCDIQDGILSLYVFVLNREYVVEHRTHKTNSSSKGRNNSLAQDDATVSTHSRANTHSRLQDDATVSTHSRASTHSRLQDDATVSTHSRASTRTSTHSRTSLSLAEKSAASIHSGGGTSGSRRRTTSSSTNKETDGRESSMRNKNKGQQKGVSSNTTNNGAASSRSMSSRLLQQEKSQGSTRELLIGGVGDDDRGHHAGSSSTTMMRRNGRRSSSRDDACPTINDNTVITSIRTKSKHKDQVKDKIPAGNSKAEATTPRLSHTSKRDQHHAAPREKDNHTDINSTSKRDMVAPAETGVTSTVTKDNNEMKREHRSGGTRRATREREHRRRRARDDGLKKSLSRRRSEDNTKKSKRVEVEPPSPAAELPPPEIMNCPKRLSAYLLDKQLEECLSVTHSANEARWSRSAKTDDAVEPGEDSHHEHQPDHEEDFLLMGDDGDGEPCSFSSSSRAAGGQQLQHHQQQFRVPAHIMKNPKRLSAFLLDKQFLLQRCTRGLYADDGSSSNSYRPGDSSGGEGDDQSAAGCSRVSRTSSFAEEQLSQSASDLRSIFSGGGNSSCASTSYHLSQRSLFETSAGSLPLDEESPAIKIPSPPDARIEGGTDTHDWQEGLESLFLLDQQEEENTLDPAAVLSHHREDQKDNHGSEEQEHQQWSDDGTDGGQYGPFHNGEYAHADDAGSDPGSADGANSLATCHDEDMELKTNMKMRLKDHEEKKKEKAAAHGKKKRRSPRADNRKRGARRDATKEDNMQRSFCSDEFSASVSCSSSSIASSPSSVMAELELALSLVLDHQEAESARKKERNSGSDSDSTPKGTTARRQTRGSATGNSVSGDTNNSKTNDEVSYSCSSSSSSNHKERELHRRTFAAELA